MFYMTIPKHRWKSLEISRTFWTLFFHSWKCLLTMMITGKLKYDVLSCVLHTKTHRAVHHATCHSFISPPQPHYCLDRTRRLVTHLMTEPKDMLRDNMSHKRRQTQQIHTHRQPRKHTKARVLSAVLIHSRTGIHLHKHSCFCVDGIGICDTTTT